MGLSRGLDRTAEFGIIGSNDSNGNTRGWTLGLHVISMAIRSCQSIRISNGDSLAILCGSCIVHNMDTKYTIEYGFYPIDGTTWSVVRHTAVPGGLGITVTVARFRTKEHAEAFLATL